MEALFDAQPQRLGTFCTQWDFIKDRFGESDLLPFSISDMDFKSPEAVLHALKKRLDHGVFGYTRWNHETYKQAIENWYRNRFHTAVEPSHLVYSPSVCYTIAQIMKLKTKPGDHVIFHTPAYDAFFNLIEANDRV